MAVLLHSEMAGKKTDEDIIFVFHIF